MSDSLFSTSSLFPTISKLEIRQVTRLFGQMRALYNVSLTLDAGDILALVGANGAGKSTLMSLLSMTTRPTLGKILVNGEEAVAADLRGSIGYLSHKPFVYPDLTCKENLLLFARLYGLSPKPVVSELCDRLDLGEFFDDRKVGVLSRGQLQRVSLARALVASPSLLLLDEPATGMDATATRRIVKLLKAHHDRGGISVVISHEPQLVAEVATRIVALRRGKVVADESGPFEAAQVPTLLLGRNP